LNCTGFSKAGLHPAQPGTKLVGDITYIPTWEGWLYLATVIDCATKACVGYAMADHMRTPLVASSDDLALACYYSPDLLDAPQARGSAVVDG